MKKSTMYEQAALSVLKNETLTASMRLDIIRVLLDSEHTAKICEKVEERERAEKEEKDGAENG